MNGQGLKSPMQLLVLPCAQSENEHVLWRIALPEASAGASLGKLQASISRLR